MEGAYNVLKNHVQYEHEADKKGDTHFNPVDTLIPPSPVQVEARDIASWQVSFIKRRISFG